MRLGGEQLRRGVNGAGVGWQNQEGCCREGRPGVLDEAHLDCGQWARGEGAHRTDLQKPWRRVRKGAGLEDVRIHDLRHTFAPEAVMGEDSLPMVGRILGHIQAQTPARYAHLVDDPLRRASERIASSQKQAMDG